MHKCLLAPRTILALATCRRAPTCSRRQLSTATPSFTSFFFHNLQWIASPRDSITLGSPSYRDVAIAQSSAAFKDEGAMTLPRLLKVYAQLSKARLTTLVVLTATSAVALSPFPTTIPVLLSTAVGTALCSASANTLNQLQEVPFDAQMARTRARPLVRRAISPLHALAFAVVTGISGPIVLWTMCNLATSLLGAANIFLYAGVYTWMKRRSIFNTLVGSVVGALPPLMGWAACGGKLLPSLTSPVGLFLPPFLSPSVQPPLDLLLVDNPLSPLALFMLLYSWQYPHFNSLSYIVRGSYAQAGYQMLSVVSPSRNAMVSLRHALLLLPICSVVIPLSGLTTWAFALSSLLPNLICARAAWRFWSHCGEQQAKAIFHHSLWYLPVMFALMMLHKQGVDWLTWIGLREKVELDGS